MKVSEYIAYFLKKYNIDTIFGYIGGFDADIIDMYCLNKDNKFILNYHEQASAFCANAYSTIKEKVGVSMSSGAPSSCNVIAGIANAYFDSHPCLFITGSVHSMAINHSRQIRQNVFEELDMVSLTKDITKYSARITDKNDIRYELEKAIYIASEGRKGPVLIDIPYNISREEIEPDNLKSFLPPKTNYDEIPSCKIKELLKNSKKPVILLGGGAGSAICRKEIKKLLAKVKIPVVASLCGLDVLAHNNPCFIGFIGDYGNRYANLALANADLIMILGSRLDERQLGGYRTKFKDSVKIIRVDVDKPELKRKFREDISIYSKTQYFLESLNKLDFKGLNYSKWFDVIKKWSMRYPSVDKTLKKVEANSFLNIISDYLSDNAIICADVGQNQMCCAQALKLDNERRLLNSAGYGSMGYSLPASIGAYYANPDAQIISINGDGGLMMNIQELQTLKRDKIPVKIIVLNNNCLGMIRRLQENLFDNRTVVSIEGYKTADFEKIARSFDFDYVKVTSVEQYEGLRKYFNSKNTVLIEVILEQCMKNYPEPGACLDRQKPELTEAEYKEIEREADL